MILSQLYTNSALLFLTLLCSNYVPFFYDKYEKNTLIKTQSQFYLYKYYEIKNNKYDKKNIPVYCFCKHGKTVETSETITLFVHGYRDTYRQVYRYIKNPRYHNDCITSDCFITFDFADAEKKIISPNLKETSLAQENEMYRLHRVLKSIKKQAKEVKKIILFGVSRGASTVITTLSRYNHPEISAIVLESPFAQLQDVINNKLKNSPYKFVPYVEKISKPITNFLLFRHNFNGITPLKVITKLPKTLPILIIATKTDSLIPYTSSQMLYLQLLKYGYTNVHFTLFNYGYHAKLILHQQAHSFENTVHSFYKKYNFPHDEQHIKIDFY